MARYEACIRTPAEPRGTRSAHAAAAASPDEFRKIIDEQRANRVFQHQREFEDKIRQEIIDRKMQNRQGPKNRIRALRL